MSTSTVFFGSIRPKCTLRPWAKAIAAPSRMLGAISSRVDVGLQLVGRRHHHQVGPFGGVGHRHHLQAVGLDLLGGRRAGLEADGDVLDAGILEVERMRPALAAIADDGDLLALDQIEIGVAIVIDAHVVSFLVECQIGRPCGRRLRSVKSERTAASPALASRAIVGRGQLQPVAEQQPDLHVAADQPEEGAERRLRHRRKRAARPSRAASSTGFSRSPIAKRPFSSTMAPRSLLSDAGMADRHPVERDRGVAGDHLQPVRRRSAPGSRVSEARSSRCAVDRRHPHLRRLPLHGRRQQPVAVAEPFVERFLGAACAARHGGHGQLVALLDQQAKRRVEHLLLARRRALRRPAFPSSSAQTRLPYRTLRFGNEP